MRDTDWPEAFVACFFVVAGFSLLAFAIYCDSTRHASDAKAREAEAVLKLEELRQK